MKRLLAIGLGAVCLVVLVARIQAGPGAPFGGDDGGCTPDTASHLRCANTIARAFGNLVTGVIRCHRRQALARLNHTAFDEESCEEATPSSGGRSAEEKFNAKLSKIAPLCSAAQLTAAGSLRDTLLASRTNPDSLDALDGIVYCDSSSGSMIDDSTGGAMVDDAGWVPANSTIARCENMVGMNLSTLVTRVIRCHMKLAATGFSGRTFDEEGCEAKGVTRYNSTADRLTSMGICPACQSNANQKATGTATVSRFENANASMYPCAGTTTTTTVTTTTVVVVTTTTVPTTTTTLIATTTTTTLPIPTTTTTSTTTTTTTLCSCGGTVGDPHLIASTTAVGVGSCGHLESDTNPNFFSLACAGLYVGGSAVGVPLPFAVPDNAASISNVSCVGTSLTLTGSTPAQAGGNRCSGGSNHNLSCTTNADCPGGTCNFLRCTNAGCLFGPPLPLPNGNTPPTSTCVINTITANGAGTGDCTSGQFHNYNLPLGSNIYLTSDLLANRCVGGPTPGAGCGGAGGTCSTTPSNTCGTGGTCVNDTGRCASGFSDPANKACCSAADCSSGVGACDPGQCIGGSNANFGCITSADCPGGTCRTMIQPCPICNNSTHKCNGGPNDGLACTPISGPTDGDLPTSHECPPPTALSIGTLAIGFVLDTGTISKTAVDNPTGDQVNVFCGFCRNKISDTFARKCNGSPTGANCSSDTTCAPNKCLPVPCNPANGNADCATATGFTSCGQRTAGAFTADDVARTIVETGHGEGPIVTGGPSLPQTLVSIFCIPPSFSPAVDAAADLPGPGAVALFGTVQMTP